MDRAIVNATYTGIILRTFGDVLSAIGVEKGWLSAFAATEPVSPFVLYEMKVKLDRYYKQARVGELDQPSFSRLTRRVKWTYARIVDDIYGLQFSYGCKHQQRGRLLRKHFARDWAKLRSSMFEAFNFSIEGRKGHKISSRDPLKMIQHGFVEAKEPETRRKSFMGKTDKKGKQPEFNYEKGLAEACVNFWFSGHSNLCTLQKLRDRHLVIKHQPSVYGYEDVDSLQRLSTKQRASLKARCLWVHGAIENNIMMLCAELNCHRWAKLDDLDPSDLAEEGPAPFVLPALPGLFDPPPLSALPARCTRPGPFDPPRLPVLPELLARPEPSAPSVPFAPPVSSTPFDPPPIPALRAALARSAPPARPVPSTRSARSAPSTTSTPSSRPVSALSVNLQTAYDLKCLHVKRRKAEVQAGQQTLGHLREIHTALRQDLAAIKGMFGNDKATERDTDILLFYASLFTHGWNYEWYHVPSINIVNHFLRNPTNVMCWALNIDEPKLPKVEPEFESKTESDT